MKRYQAVILGLSLASVALAAFPQEGTTEQQAPQTLRAPHASAATAQTQNVQPQHKVDDEAFARMEHTLLPMSAEQIQHLRHLFNQTQSAVAQTGAVPAKPVSSSVVVNLAPGATPPVIRLQAGFVTSLVFLDSTGAPWPVRGYDLGDPNSFNIQWNKKDNTVLVQAITFYKRGNLAVMLDGLNTPVMLTLLAGQHAVDYRVDLRIPGLGPNAIPSRTGMPMPAGDELLHVLDGVPPEDSKVLQVTGGEAQAWLIGGQLYLRTRMTVISPGWISMMAGPDDSIHAYRLPAASVVLAIRDGKVIRLNVKGL